VRRRSFKVPEECLPALRRRSTPHHVFRHRRLGDLKAKHQQLAMDPRCSPPWVFLAHPSDEIAQLSIDLWPACPSAISNARKPARCQRRTVSGYAQAIAAIDLFVVPTLTFERLFAFLVLSHGRRQLLWFEVTRHPTAEWLARQITEAFPWASAPAYLVRDNDRAYRHAFTSRVRAMGIRDRPISPGSPWQNPYVERLIGTVRRECLDRVLVFGEAHLRQILSSYAAPYNEVRTHLALGKDAPLGRAVQRTGVIVAIPILSGLHHHYVRI
jgi:transposase InsO family protein